jgi:rsbT antagonist protein RsbS
MTEIYDSSDIARITIQPHRGALIASIQVDLDQRVLERFQADLLQRIEDSRARFVIIDLTGVAVMDESDFAALRRTIDMVSLMGTDTILCGLRPGVAASLVDLDVSIAGLRTQLNLDAALAEIAARESRTSRIGDADGATDPERVDGYSRNQAFDSE